MTLNSSIRLNKMSPNHYAHFLWRKRRKNHSVCDSTSHFTIEAIEVELSSNSEYECVWNVRCERRAIWLSYPILEPRVAEFNGYKRRAINSDRMITVVTLLQILFHYNSQTKLEQTGPDESEWKITLARLVIICLDIFIVHTLCWMRERFVGYFSFHKPIFV